MKKTLVLITLLLFCCINMQAQYNTPQNRVWTFGVHSRLDFGSGSPVAGGISPMDILEGCATVSDASGSLLFLTDGDAIYNRMGTLMPLGADIVPFSTFSTNQATVIVPFPGNPNKYYVFSQEQYFAGQLAYSVVDMTLDGGLGDLVPGSIALPLNTGMSENMVSIRGSNCNIWLITHKADTNLFCVYEINAAGISAPAMYTLGAYHGAGTYAYGYGGMAISHDGQKLFASSYSGSFGSYQSGELFDFDPGTGVISNYRALTLSQGFYAGEFSPDNTKLYLASYHSSAAGDPKIIQYDVSLPTTAAIIASRTVIGPSGTSALKLGPDGRIYVGRPVLDHIDCIPNPNAAGLACGYMTPAVSLAPGYVKNGLPNTVWHASTGVLLTITGSPNICLGSTVAFTASTGGGTWSSSNTTVATVSVSGTVTGIAPGTATISYGGPGLCGSSFTVTVNPQPVPPDGAHSWCQGDTITLTNAVGGGTWSSSHMGVAAIGSATGIAAGVSPGTARITYAIGACFVTEMITINPLPASITGPSSVCIGDTIWLASASTGGTWASSSTTTATAGSATGAVKGISAGTITITYTFTATGCRTTANITVNDCELGIGQFNKAETINIYPIPTGGNVWINCNTGFAPGMRAVLYDMAGRALLRLDLRGSSCVLDMSALAAGTYQLLIGDSDNNTLRRRVLVKQ